MISRVLLLPLALVSLAAFAAPAAPAVPNPVTSSVEPVLVGDSNGALIGDGFRVTVRDAANNPIGNSSVVLHFAGTVRPYTQQVPPANVTCPTIVMTTNALGEAVFQARFGGFANAPAIGVIADGVFLSTVLARSTDINADGKTDAFDFALFRNNFLNNPGAPETDYNEDGVTNPFDLNIFRMVFLNDIPGTLCP
jgi:hypothetical protein